MLKNIPKTFTPDLLKFMMEMGHSDTIVIADANFPAHSNNKNVVKIQNISVNELLDLILNFLPLDSFTNYPVTLIDNNISNNRPKVWEDFKDTIIKHHSIFIDFEYIDRFSFYELAKKSYVIVQTTDNTKYATLILKKGVL